MVQLECPRVRHPLMSSTYKVFVAAYISFVSERRLASRRAGGLCENTSSTLYSHQMNGRFREITHITSCPYAMFRVKTGKQINNHFALLLLEELNIDKADKTIKFVPA